MSQNSGQRCAVYARVSTDMQGESLENQVSYAQEYVRRLGENFHMEEGCVYTDFDQSGYYTRFLERPAIQRALMEAGLGRYDVIVFKEISRISRDQAEHVEIVSRFAQAGVRMIAINDNLDSAKPDTLDLLGIHSVMAEMESKRISSRVSTGKKMLARRGVWTGEAPIGYRVNAEKRQLEIDPENARTVKLIFELFTVQGFGLMKIAEFLNQRGMATKRGHPWSRGTVGQILQNPAYAGDLVYGKTRNELRRLYDERGYSKRKGRRRLAAEDWVVVPNAHPALITRAVFEQAQARRDRRSQQNPRKSRHPLTGILVCGHCGSGMVCQTRNSATRVYRYYVCATAFRFGRAACRQPNLPAETLETTLWNYVITHIQQALRSSDGHFVVEAARSKAGSLQREVTRMTRVREQAQLGLRRLLSDMDVSQTSYEQLKCQFIGEIDKAERDLARLQAMAVDHDRQDVRRLAPTDVLRRFATLPGGEHEQLVLRRSRFHALFDSVTVQDYDVGDIRLRYCLDSVCPSCDAHIHGSV